VLTRDQLITDRWCTGLSDQTCADKGPASAARNLSVSEDLLLPESASQENTNIWKTLLTQATAAGLIFAFGTKLTILTFAQAFGKPREGS
jgi:hypothetical protein